jgi:hypothetical protein
MPALDATALNTDPEGLAFLRDVLGTPVEMSPERRFPLEAWTSKATVVANDGSFAAVAAPTPGQTEPCFAEALA